MPAGIIPRCNKGFDPRPFGQSSTASVQPVFDLLQALRDVTLRLAHGCLCEQGRCSLTDRAGVNFHPQSGNPPFPVQIKTHRNG